MSKWKQWCHFWQFRFLLLTFFICVAAPLLMNHQPLLVKDVHGDFFFPALGGSEFEMGHVKPVLVIHAPIPYSPVKSDLMNAGFVSPFDPQYELTDTGERIPVSWYKRHWFGTDLRGGDVLSYSVFGLRNSFFISFLALLISLIIGALLGFVSGWRLNNPLKIGWGTGLVILLWCVFTIHGVLNIYSVSDRVVFLSIVTMVAAGLMYSLQFLKRKYVLSVRFDFLSDRVSEIFIAIPRMILLMVLVQYFGKSIFAMALIIGVTGWIDLARLIRSETVRLREQTYVEAAKMTGQGVLRLFIFHILPNIWPSVMVVAMYGFSSNIIMESSLSFLGMGLPPDQPSIGTLLSEAKSYYEYWWLFVFPGLWLSMVIYALFTIPARIGKSGH